MDHELRGWTFAYNYIHDLHIASKDSDEPNNHLRMVFKHLEYQGILINSSKCKLGVPQLQFFGHQIDSQGIRPLRDKVQAVKEFPPPTTTHKLWEFLGFVNFYHHFLPNTALILQPNAPMSIMCDVLDRAVGAVL